MHIHCSHTRLRLSRQYQRPTAHRCSQSERRRGRRGQALQPVAGRVVTVLATTSASFSRVSRIAFPQRNDLATCSRSTQGYASTGYDRAHSWPVRFEGDLHEERTELLDDKARTRPDGVARTGADGDRRPVACASRPLSCVGATNGATYASAACIGTTGCSSLAPYWRPCCSVVPAEVGEPMRPASSVALKRIYKLPRDCRK
jgi:hypothetical protein